MPEPHDLTPLKDVRSHVRENLPDGCTCPACGQYAKLYARPLTSAMAYGLILLDRYDRQKPSEWVHLENYLKSLPGVPSSIRGDLPKLRFWGLIERAADKRDDGSPRNGLYRITYKGKAFVHHGSKVPAKAHIFNNVVDAFSVKTVTIKEALGKRFDYRELMYDRPEEGEVLHAAG